MTFEKIYNDMIAALKAGDKNRKDVLSTLVDNCKKEAINRKNKDNITEEIVDAVILKEKKTVEEMVSTCPESRNDLLEQYKEKLTVVTEYAPQLITDEIELKSMILSLLENSNIGVSKSNKGLVMKTVAPTLKGKADMAVVNKVVGDLLI